VTQEQIRVVVADDQAIVRDGLVTVLDLLPDVTVVGEAADGAEACARVAELHPDVVLMDLRMPVLDGAAATARIAAEHPSTAVLVLTTFADDASIMGALRAGARGYLTKDASRAEVAAAVRAVARGQTTLAPQAAASLLDSADRDGSAGRVARRGTSDASRPAEGRRAEAPDPAALHARFPALTAREADVLALIGDGLSNHEIASRLFVSVATVKTHINAIFAKLAVRDRAQAIALVRS
jgi:Response regulator containing a CheY-like receiver domain and an HTH DNA-binding domain